MIFLVSLNYFVDQLDDVHLQYQSRSCSRSHSSL